MPCTPGVAVTLTRTSRCLPQRIMSVKYSFPANLKLSADCLDLVTKIFNPNPAQRITVADIKKHPWFLKNLPAELMVCSILRSSSPTCLPLPLAYYHHTHARQIGHTVVAFLTQPALQFECQATPI
jgi:serine/threonine protein kinase